VKVKVLSQAMNDRFVLTGCILIFLLYIFLFIGTGGHVLIHDYLDSNLVWLKLLSESGKIFTGLNSEIPNIMNGLNRNLYGSEFSVILWLHYFFDSFKATLINQVLIRVIAFWGILSLLKNYFLDTKHSKIILFTSSLCFALLPFYPPAGLTVAGQPLALNAFLNIRNRRHSSKDWLALSLIPFYSSFVLGFVFFLFGVFLLWFFDLCTIKRKNLTFLLSIIVMVSVYLLIEYRLIYTLFLNEDFISHRTAWRSLNLGFKESLFLSLEMFKFGQYHASSLHHYVISVSALIAFFLGLAKDKTMKLLVVLFLVIVAISLVYGFSSWQGFNNFILNFSIIRSFQYDRFYFLFPILWSIIFCLSLNEIKTSIIKYGKMIVIIMLLLQLIILFFEHNAVRGRKNPTFREFYSESLFSDINDFIGKEKSTYRVVSIGIHPSISQYNGFYTLDGYMPNYTLSYKHEFREIIEKELEKDIELAKYFDEWGSRCYIFSSEIGRNYYNTKEKSLKIIRINLNTAKLYEMGGRYVFSALEIANSGENNLELLSTFQNSDSPWQIHLYGVNKINE
jgi:hypothetical protein